MSNALTLMVTAGGLAGAGLAVFVSGFNPPRPALSDALDRLSRPQVAPFGRRRRLDVAIAAPLRHFGLPRDRTLRDLTILDRDPAEYLAQQVVIAVSGMLILGALPAVWGLGGQLPLWLALLGAAIAVRLTHSRLHTAAEARRAEMRETLSTLLDLVGGGLSGGAGVEQSLGDTMDELSGWAAIRIRRELAAAAQTRGRQRVHAWTALRDLGTQVGVDELTELATAMEQAAGGAPVAETMSVVARSMRARMTADMERQAHAASAQMAIPIMLFGLGYLIFLLYAAMGAISASLTQ
ncbi:Flp pilus assembly protein TadB [Micromonospora sp. Llam0]|uniref:type II secretion protein F n=1 Tax=Micromonospora sp. Llam0 TaxID=2485143 RepID=UPI000F483E47|nr:type II secretion protein F [Micromonospora sp. Llam0]ROO60370.1 Flp pilus assembly protein TadB [Micromonospora sp. Llam0]